MKSLKLCFESLLDDEDIFYGTNSDKKVIESWIKDNYAITGKLTISDDFVVDCDGEVEVKNENITSLTNGLFMWNNVGGCFNCSYCKKLTSLDGSPKKVNMGYYCNGCNSLTSLEGAPEKIGRNFYCDDCKKLTSLKGSPKKVTGDFVCSGCNKLTTLEGAPEAVGGSFNCRKCSNLKTLEGAPEKIGRGFWCSDCPKLTITDSDREKYKIEN